MKGAVDPAEIWTGLGGLHRHSHCNPETVALEPGPDQTPKLDPPPWANLGGKPVLTLGDAEPPPLLLEAAEGGF